MKSRTEMIEGPEAWKRFAAGMKHALTVPHEEIKRRIEEQRKQSAANPHRRGPKPRVKPSGPSGHGEAAL